MIPLRALPTDRPNPFLANTRRVGQFTTSPRCLTHNISFVDDAARCIHLGRYTLSIDPKVAPSKGQCESLDVSIQPSSKPWHKGLTGRSSFQRSLYGPRNRTYGFGFFDGQPIRCFCCQWHPRSTRITPLAGLRQGHSYDAAIYRRLWHLDQRHVSRCANGDADTGPPCGTDGSGSPTKLHNESLLGFRNDTDCSWSRFAVITLHRFGCMPLLLFGNVAIEQFTEQQ